MNDKLTMAARRQLYANGAFPFKLVYTRAPTIRALARHQKRFQSGIIRNKWDVFIACLRDPSSEIGRYITRWVKLASSPIHYRGRMKLPAKSLRLHLEQCGYRIALPWETSP